MAVSVTLPALGESVTEGTVTRWLKQVGDQVQTDEPLLEVSTDKVDTEIPSPANGVLLEIKVGEDETVEVGTELAVIGESGEAREPVDTSAGQPAEPSEAPAQAPGGAAAPAEPSEAPAQAPGGAAAPAEPSEAPDQAPGGEATPGMPVSAEAGTGGAGTAGASPAGEPAAAEEPAPATVAEGGAATPAGNGASGTPVALPALGESVTEGTVTRWLKQVGDEVQVDEPLLEVSTDKVDTEIPSPVAGVVLEIKVGEDETVGVGTELAVIGAPGATAAAPAPAPPAQGAAAPAAPAPQPTPAPAAAAPQPAPTPAPAPTVPAPAPSVAAPAPTAERAPAGARPPAEEAAPSGAPYVTPLVRKLAAEHNIDLGTIQGTGVGGRIRKQDVLAAAEAARQRAAEAPAASPEKAPAAAAEAPAVAPSPLRGKTEKMSRLRSLIAERMVESLRVSAQLTTVVEVDVTALARLRQRAKNDFEAREGVKLSFLPFFAKAAIEALKQHPMLNATMDSEQGTITYFDVEHLGIAVDTERGLIVPVIKNAGDLNLAGLARKIADLAERTRSNKITPDELSGGTFTITNTGSLGVLFDTPIINQPQVGILGTGTVVKRPVVIDDPTLGETIAVRSMCYLSLTYDHRLVDGADAARFLSTIKKRLEAGRFEGELGL